MLTGRGVQQHHHHRRRRRRSLPRQAQGTHDSLPRSSYRGAVNTAYRNTRVPSAAVVTLTPARRALPPGVPRLHPAGASGCSGDVQDSLAHLFMAPCFPSERDTV